MSQPTHEEVNQLEVMIRRHGIRDFLFALAELCDEYHRASDDARWSVIACMLERASNAGLTGRASRSELRVPHYDYSGDADALKLLVEDFKGCPHQIDATTVHKGVRATTPVANFAISSDARLYAEHLAIRLREAGFQGVSVDARDTRAAAHPKPPQFADSTAPETEGEEAPDGPR